MPQHQYATPHAAKEAYSALTPVMGMITKALENLESDRPTSLLIVNEAAGGNTFSALGYPISINQRIVVNHDEGFFIKLTFGLPIKPDQDDVHLFTHYVSSEGEVFSAPSYSERLNLYFTDARFHRHINDTLAEMLLHSDHLDETPSE